MFLLRETLQNLLILGTCFLARAIWEMWSPNSGVYALGCPCSSLRTECFEQAFILLTAGKHHNNNRATLNPPYPCFMYPRRGTDSGVLTTLCPRMLSEATAVSESCQGSEIPSNSSSHPGSAGPRACPCIS